MLPQQLKAHHLSFFISNYVLKETQTKNPMPYITSFSYQINGWDSKKTAWHNTQCWVQFCLCNTVCTQITWYYQSSNHTMPSHRIITKNPVWVQSCLDLDPWRMFCFAVLHNINNNTLHSRLMSSSIPLFWTFQILKFSPLAFPKYHRFKWKSFR